MSVRRFAAYFLAVTAGSTVAFASFLSAPGAASPEASSLEAAAETSPTPEMSLVLQRLREQQRRKLAAKHSQIALAEFHVSH